jgi:type IV secretion system protein TrbL
MQTATKEPTVARKLTTRIIVPLGLAVLTTAVAHAQTAPQSAPSNLLASYQQAAGGWARVGFAHAQTLFGILAAIEVAWTASMLALEKDSIEAWIPPIIKKILVLGFFYMLLSQNQLWLPAIINSFSQIGQESAGLSGPLNPSDILMTGLKISGNMLAAAIPSTTSVVGAVAAMIPGVGSALTAASLLPTLIVLLGAIMVFLAYLVITISFIMATIESYIALGAGVIFLGFGASRWTIPYVERYLSLAVSTGVRLMVLYMVIGLGQQLSQQWIVDAANLPLTVAGCQSILGILAGAVTYMAIAWSVPKMVSGVLSGSLSMSSGDMTGAMTAMAVGGATAAAAIATGGTALVGAAGVAGASGAAGAAGAGAGAAGAGGMFSAGTGTATGAVSAASMSTEAGTALAVDPIVESGGGMAGSAMSGGVGGSNGVDPMPGGGGGVDTTSGDSDSSSAVPLASGESSPQSSGSDSPATGTAAAGSASPSSTGVAPPPSVGASSGSGGGDTSSSGGGTSAPGSAGSSAGTSQASEAQQPGSSGGVSTGNTEEGEGTSSKPSESLADTIKSVRDETSHLASHAPNDSTPASAAQLNISHGE